MLAGCGQKTASTQQSAVPTAAAPAPAAEPPAPQDQRPSAETSAQTALRPAPAASSPSAQSTASLSPSLEDFTDEPALQDVFFEPGRADIGRSGTRFLKDNARWLLENPGNLVLIEGHTDYRGNREANLAIGERRAKAVVNFLLKEGIPDTRLWTVSHGSDNPVCPEKTDACAAKNRRVHFRVKKQ